jgi:hypothetical protein
VVKAKISSHYGLDWCHLCGERKHLLVDVSYANNVADEDEGAVRSKYLRICGTCVTDMATIITGMSKG